MARWEWPYSLSVVLWAQVLTERCTFARRSARPGSSVKMSGQEPREGPEGGSGYVGLDVGEKTPLAGCGEDGGVSPCPWPRAGHAESEAETDGSPE